MTGRVGGESISLHSEGDKVILTGAEGVREGVREEVDLKAPGRRVPTEDEAPGTSVLDGVLDDLKVLDEPPKNATPKDDDEERA